MEAILHLISFLFDIALIVACAIIISVWVRRDHVRRSVKELDIQRSYSDMEWETLCHVYMENGKVWLLGALEFENEEHNLGYSRAEVRHVYEKTKQQIENYINHARQEAENS